MQPQDFHVADQKAGALDGRDHLGRSRDVATRKDAFGDPGAGHIGAGGAADRMQEHDAVIGEQLGTAAEIGLVEVDADMLEHADRYDALERAGDVAIVLQQEARRARKAFLGRARIRRLELFRRERDAGDVGVRYFSEIETKAAPAAADVEHAVAGAALVYISLKYRTP